MSNTVGDVQMKFCECGRSMVEMLGVLAIIGVLSVGAIAGYSKAMTKYKLNKQAEQFTQLFSTILPYDSALGRNDSSSGGYEQKNLIPLLKKLNAIPTEMLVNGIDTYIEDVFKNQISIYSVHEPTYNSRYYQISFSLKSASSVMVENCRNVVIAAKAYTGELYQIISGIDAVQRFRYYGDMYCNDSVTCLKDVTLQQIDDLCQACSAVEGSCGLNILWGRQGS